MTDKDSTPESAPADLIEALRLAIEALNAAPSFDTGIQNPKRPKESLSSYALIPQLTATLRRYRS